LPKVSGIPSHCEHIVRKCERSLHKGPQNSKQNMYEIVLDMLSAMTKSNSMTLHNRIDWKDRLPSPRDNYSNLDIYRH
jgi:hypothetical protein